MPRLASPQVPPPTARPDLDLAVERLRDRARAFARTSPRQKAEWLEQIRARFMELAPEMVELGCRAHGIDPSSALAGEEWLSGPAISLRALRLFAQSLFDVAARGAPRLPGGVGRSPDDRPSVSLHPLDNYDRTLFLGYECEAWLEHGALPEQLASHQASFYRKQAPEGHVVLVLGAGNVGSISILDVLYHSFVEGGVCLLKMNPVNAYLGPLYERAFAPLIERGFLSIAHGGGEVGEYLLGKDAIDAVHVTGSVDTHDHIVWGPPGLERERRKREGAPLIRKRVTSELGNVSPALVVPARYSDRELERVARSLAGMMVNNASFNCVALKLLVTARGWPQREELLARLGRVLASEPTRFAYYPGADARHAKLVAAADPGAVRHFGEVPAGHLPWTLVTGLDAGAPSPLFEVEPFCSVSSEAVLDAGTASEFLAGATRFVNEHVFGTLNALIVLPDGLDRDVEVARALDRALVELRYGTVCINAWPAVGYGLGAPPWGGAPGATLTNAQSGLGWGHNALLLERVHKVVLKSPLMALPEPFWCPGQKKLAELGRAISEHEAAPSLRRAARAAWYGIAG